LLSAGAEYRLLGIIRCGGRLLGFRRSDDALGGHGLQLLGINLDASVASISGTTRLA